MVQRLPYILNVRLLVQLILEVLQQVVLVALLFNHLNLGLCDEEIVDDLRKALPHSYGNVPPIIEALGVRCLLVPDSGPLGRIPGPP